MENVRGLVNMNDGKTIKNIQNTFRKLGYDVDYKVLNAADYGVPQMRYRVFIMANNVGLPVKFPVQDYFKNPGKGQKPYKKVGDVINDLTNKQNFLNHKLYGIWNKVPVN